VPEHGRGAAVLLARFPVARLVHEGLPFHGADTQAADDDVDVDVPGTVVTVRGGAGLEIRDPQGLETEINSWPGVVTVGLFAARGADVLLLGTSEGVKTFKRG